MMQRPLLPRVNRTRALLLRGASQYDSGATRLGSMGQQGLAGQQTLGGAPPAAQQPGLGGPVNRLGGGSMWGGGSFPGQAPPGGGHPGQAPGGPPGGAPNLGQSRNIGPPLPPDAPIRTSPEGQAPITTPSSGQVHSMYDAPEAWRSANSGAAEMQGPYGPLPQLADQTYAPGGLYVHNPGDQQAQQQAPGSLMDMRSRLAAAQRIAQQAGGLPGGAQNPTQGGVGPSTGQAPPDPYNHSVSADTAAPVNSQIPPTQTSGRAESSAPVTDPQGNEVSTATPAGTQRLTDAGYYVDANGNVWAGQGGADDPTNTNYGNVNDPSTWGPEVVKVLGTGQRGDSGSMTPEQIAQQRALEQAGYWVDPKTGNVYQPDANGHVDASEFNVMGNVYDGSYTGRAKGVVDKISGPQGHAWDAVLQEILGLAKNVPQMDQTAIAGLQHSNDQRSAFDAARAIRASLASSSRARMGGGFQAGLTGEISSQAGIARQQQDAQISYNAAVQNLQLRAQGVAQQIAALQAKMSVLAGTEAAAAAAKVEQSLLQEKAQIDMQLAQYQASAALPGQILGGVLGAGGTLLGGWAGGGFK